MWPSPFQLPHPHMYGPSCFALDPQMPLQDGFPSFLLPVFQGLPHPAAIPSHGEALGPLKPRSSSPSMNASLPSHLSHGGGAWSLTHAGVFSSPSVSAALIAGLT